jgi:hypothetical protein
MPQTSTDLIKPYITGSYAPFRACKHALPVNGSRMGVFDQIFTVLVAENGPPERLMIDATHLKAPRTACSLLKGGMFPALSIG